jgi:hypothetical protein
MCPCFVEKHLLHNEGKEPEIGFGSDKKIRFKVKKGRGTFKKVK